MAATVSYSGLSDRELGKLWRQGRHSRIACEAGHHSCGCSRDKSQDGKAPCFQEIEREVIWRGGSVETLAGMEEGE